jgi:hypothetical protein
VPITLPHVTLDSTTAQILLLIAVVVGVAGLVLGLVAQFRLSSLRRSYSLLQADEGRETFVDVVGRTVEDFADLRDDVRDLERVLTKTRRDLAASLRHVSVVRYDAFGDLGGRFSFSAALLDDAGDGLVITSIHARAETRTYFKGVTGGVADIDLSPEEAQAVQLARGDGR